ncbi:MAG: NADP oxidoreductase [Candidatus Heimdallarchaeota archaeon]|nr:MAG: NADP oxidoreductase [Candidatus Heimdallarchaeota archaeon]
MSKKIRLATAWLDGCSGCHMSLLDMDESIVDLAPKIDLIYSPMVDYKFDEIPNKIDITLVEGAIGNEHDLKELRTLRSKSKLLIAVGDCAVTGNIPSMRNYFKSQTVLNRAYVENTDHNPQIPEQNVPKLIEVLPLHHEVNVDLFIQGCPPPSNIIQYVLTELIGGRIPNLKCKQTFG